MTYREMLQRDKPKEVNTAFRGGCAGCPGEQYPGGPVDRNPGCRTLELGQNATADDYEAACTACWDQEAGNRL